MALPYSAMFEVSETAKKQIIFLPCMSDGMCVSPSNLNHIPVASLILGAI